MDLWPRHPATGADRRHHLTTAHLVAAFDQKGLGVAIGRHPPVGVFDQKKVAKTAEPGAGIGDDAVFRRLDRRAARRRDVDPVIMQPALARPEAADDAPRHRRQKAAAGARRRAEQGATGRGLGDGAGAARATVVGAVGGGARSPAAGVRGPAPPRWRSTDRLTGAAAARHRRATPRRGRRRRRCAAAPAANGRRNDCPARKRYGAAKPLRRMRAWVR